MRSPAFQFYATDWLGSQRVQMLTLEEEGAYIRLLCSCWQHGSIPADPELAARIIGKGASTTLARVVQMMFQPGAEDGRLTHDRLEAEKTKQAAWRAKSAAGGRKSGEIRKGGSTTVGRVVGKCLEPNGNTPTSVSVLQTSSNKRPALSAPTFPDGFSTERTAILSEWFAYKREKRQTYTPIGWKSLITENSGCPDTELVAAVRLAMSRNYNGFSPKWVDNGGKPAAKDPYHMAPE